MCLLGIAVLLKSQTGLDQKISTVHTLWKLKLTEINSICINKLINIVIVVSEKLKQFQTCISAGLFYHPKCRYYFPRNFRYEHVDETFTAFVSLQSTWKLV